jgi:sugar-specific transcriptional regulator TrmB
MTKSPQSAMNDACESLAALGFSVNEARAYCALLTKSPANGYQVARESGIPRAKVYECLQRLVARGAAIQIESPGKDGRLYAAANPEELITSIDEDRGTALKRARKAIKKFNENPHFVEVLWRVVSQADLVERGKNLAASAKKTLHIAIWSEEFDALYGHLVAALDRKVKIALVLYAPHDKFPKFQERCPGSILHYRTKRQAVPLMGRQFVLVADMARCITGSIFSDKNVEGVFTMNLGLVTNAVDLVNHEIYLERIMVELGNPLLETFGQDLEKLDPFVPTKHLK